MSLISGNFFFIRWESLLGSVSCGSVSSRSGIFIYDVFIISWKSVIISVFSIFSWWGSIFITSLYGSGIFFNRFGSTVSVRCFTFFG